MEIKDRLAVALAEAVDEASRQMCLHDETHRAGAIWTVCGQCGVRWPDGVSKPLPKQPAWYPEAIQSLAAYKVEQDEQRAQEHKQQY
jgi:hypothetical protein